MSNLPHRLNTSAFALISFLLLFSPLLLGSNRLLPWIINGVITLLAFLLWLAAALLSRRYIPLAPGRFIWPIAAISLVFIWSAFQWLPLDMESIAHPIWAYVESLNKTDLTSRITADYRLTEQAILRLVTCSLFVWLIIQFAADPKKAKLLLQVFITSALLYGIYGLWALTQGSETILWMGKRFMQTSLTATFVNRNNAATYFGLASLVSLMLMLQAYREIFVHRRRQRSFTDWLMGLLASRVGVLLLAFLLFLGCVLLTQSRAGILSTAIALAFAITLQSLLGNRSKKGTRPSSRGFRKLFLHLFAWLSVGTYISLQVSGAGFLSRLTTPGAGGARRTELYRLCLEMIRDFPLIGTGYGTFQTAFLFYQDETLPNNVFWDKAHNTYFEILIGLGLPIGLIFLSIFIWAIIRCSKAFLHRQQHRYFAILGLSASLLVGLHALVDFSLQIQAVTLAYLAILGAAIAQSWSSRSLGSRRKTTLV